VSGSIESMLPKTDFTSIKCSSALLTIEGNKTIHFYRNEFSRNEFYLVGLVKCIAHQIVFLKTGEL